MKIHSCEIVPYPQYGEVLVRCWGCGARMWVRPGTEQQAIDGHRKNPWEKVVPRVVHAAIAKKDHGDEQYIEEFVSADAAVDWIARMQAKHGVQGWSFAYLTGHRSPLYLLEQLALPAPAQPAFEAVNEVGETVLTFDENGRRELPAVEVHPLGYEDYDDD
jgi:hypothetical protein